MICPECLTIVSSGNFCPNCGSPLKEEGFDEQGFPTFEGEMPGFDDATATTASGATAPAAAAAPAATASAATPTATASAANSAATSATAAKASYGSASVNASSASTSSVVPDDATKTQLGSTPYSPYGVGASSPSGAASTTYGVGAPFATDTPSQSGAFYDTGTPSPAGTPYSAGVQKAPATAFVLAIVGLVLSLSGIASIVGVILCIIALVLNAGYNRKGLANDRKTPTFVVGLIGLILGILTTVVIAAALVLAVNYSSSDDVDIDTYLEEVMNSENGDSDESEIPSIANPDSDDDEDGDANDSGTGTGASGSFATGGDSDGEGAGADADAANADADADAAAASQLTEAQQAFAGKWKLVGMLSNGEETSPDDLQLLEDMGMEVRLVLKKNGVAKLVMFGEETFKGTWDAASTTSATMTVDGDSVPLNLEDGVLTLSSEGSDSIMRFEKL